MIHDGPRRLAQDLILAQVPADGPNGEHGDGLAEIGRDHHLRAVWDAYLPLLERKEPQDL